MKRLAFLHTVGGLVDKFRSLANDSLPDIDSFHMLDESLLQDLMRDGPSPSITRRVVTFVGLASNAGADLIVFTCSSTSPMVDVARQCFATPIWKIDDPVAERAAGQGGRIGVLCTTNSTLRPSSDLIREHAVRLSRDVEVEPILVEGAFAALGAGDREKHDQLVGETARQVSGRCDVVVLAQASMAHLMDPLAADLSVPVLSSPPLLMDALVARASSP